MVCGLVVERVLWRGESIACRVCIFVVVMGWTLVECGGGVVVGGGCSNGDGFRALHCSRFN